MCLEVDRQIGGFLAETEMYFASEVCDGRKERSSHGLASALRIQGERLNGLTMFSAHP
jgi:hypothetical protein